MVSTIIWLLFCVYISVHDSELNWFDVSLITTFVLVTLLLALVFRSSGDKK